MFWVDYLAWVECGEEIADVKRCYGGVRQVLCGTRWDERQMEPGEVKDGVELGDSGLTMISK